MRKIKAAGAVAILAFGLTPAIPASAQDINSCMRQYNTALAACGPNSPGCMQQAAIDYAACLQELAEKNQ